MIRAGGTTRPAVSAADIAAVPDDAIIDVLQRAKDLLLERGWVGDGGYIGIGPNQERCVGLAVAIEAAPQRVLRMGFPIPALETRARHALIATSGDRCYFISRHNDVCLRDVSDAIDWLDRAIRHVKDPSLSWCWWDGRP